MNQFREVGYSFWVAAAAAASSDSTVVSPGNPTWPAGRQSLRPPGLGGTGSGPDSEGVGSAAAGAHGTCSLQQRPVVSPAGQNGGNPSLFALRAVGPTWPLWACATRCRRPAWKKTWASFLVPRRAKVSGLERTKFSTGLQAVPKEGADEKLQDRRQKDSRRVEALIELFSAASTRI